MSRFRKIFIKMWADKKFRNLSAPGPNGQTLWVFLLTGPQTTRIPGLFSTGEAGFAEIIGWPLEGFRKAFEEVSIKDMVKVDWDARLIWIPKAIFYNQPESPNVVRSWKDTWDEMSECELKLQAFQELDTFMEGLGEGYVKAFREACSEPLGNPSRKPFGKPSAKASPNPFGKASGKPFGKPSPKPLANQEQEQEQEQEEEREGGPDRPTFSENNFSGKIFSGNFSSEELKKFEIESNPTQTRTHPRLEIFVEEYKLATGQDYLVGNYRVEGGAAQRTQTKIPDDSLYRRAVRAYLENKNKRLIENGYPFLWFVHELHRWVTQAQGGTRAHENAGKYDGICE